MHSIWTTFQTAGPVGWLVIPVALLALILGIVALLGGTIGKNPRPFSFVGIVAMGIAGIGLLLGGLGAWYGRQHVEEALAFVVPSDFVQGEKMWLAGYDEARSAPMVALVLVVLPLLLALAGTAVSWLRSRDPAGRRPLVDGATAGMAAIFAFGGLVAAIVGSLPAEDTARARALDQMRTVTKSTIRRTDCDPCPVLASAIEYRGAERIDEDVPGATKRAHQCVDDWLDRIEAGVKAKRACANVREPSAVGGPPAPAPLHDGTSDDPDGAEPSARDKALRDAAEFGMIGLLGHGAKKSDRKAELQKVLDSPLLIDDAQRAQVIRRIVRQDQGRFRLCYERALRHDPDLRGRIHVRFIIGKDGTVDSVTTTGDIPNRDMIACVADQFRKIRFPQPEGGSVSVHYPLKFSPDQ